MRFFMTLQLFSYVSVLLSLSSISPLSAEEFPGFDDTDIGDDNSMIVLKINQTDEYPRNSEGSFVTLEDGTIYYAYTQFYGGGSDHASAHIVEIRSDNGGRDWTDPVVVVDNIGDMNVMSVSLLRLQDGRIAMFVLVKNNLHDLRPYILYSDDEAKTWSEPSRVFDDYGYFVVNNDRVIQHSSGRLILPAAFHRPTYRDGVPHADFRGIAFWFLSDDSGETWYQSKYWWAIPEPVESTGLQEPGVVECADGTVFSWARTNQGCQYGCWSDDAGLTFSMPEPTNLISPVSPASIKRIPDTGDLLCFYNDHSGRYEYTEGLRTPLVAAISKDNGETWPVSRLIEDYPQGHYCYTAIEFVEDGKYVLIGYCSGHRDDPDNFGLNPHRIRRINVAWIYDGEDESR